MSTSSTGLYSSNGTELIAGASYTDGNGIDVAETVAAILENDRAPEVAWENDQTSISNQESALQELQSEIATLQSSFESLSDLDGVFSGLSTTSSNSSAVTATTSGSATAGTHTIVVNNLATTGESYSNDLSSASSTITAGALVFTIGDGAQQTINIPADTSGESDGTTTLTDAAAYINQQNLGISASVVTDSGGARLSLTSTASGAAASVSVVSGPGGLTFTNVAGQDASLTVDGVPIDSSTNQVSSAITGVTLDLTGTTSSSGATIQVTPNTDQITTAVNSFISAYNAAVTDLNNQFQYNGGVADGSESSSSDSTSGALEDDTSARIIQQQLLSAISITGGSSSAVGSLAELGITMNDDGTLSLDSSTLQNELNSNYSAVEGFFQDTDSSSFAGSFSNLMTNMTDPTNSAIVLDLSGLKANYTQDQDNINTLEATLSDLQTTLVDQYSALNTTLQMYPTMLDEVETELGFNTNNNDNNS